MKAFCEFNEYEIGEYEDAGKLGKSIEGRIAFNNMMEDIKSGKDDVSFVLVFKLSRFGRNAADVLNSLQVVQDFGVNLICVEDGIDSSKEAGRLMISVLSAVAEIERENIRVQTMEGRMQKAREGRWNGGFAPYGYALVDGKLEINEEEAVAIRTIFDQYVNTDMGSNGIAKYLENHGMEYTRFVMIQGIIGAFCVRVPISYFMSKRIPVSLFHIGLATPCSTIVQIIMCFICFVMLKKRFNK